MSAERALPGEVIVGQVEPEPARTSGRPHRPPSPLSPEFVQELDAARRRVSVLEEANEAIHESLHRISRLSAFSEGLDRSASLDDVSDLLFEEVKGILPAKILMLALVEATGHEFRPHRVAPPEAAVAAAEEMRAQVASGM